MHYKNLLFTTFFILFVFDSFSGNYASIKSKSNLRVGPGKHYPIKWVLSIPNMPVKIIEKSRDYSKIELVDGTTGWIWNSTISNKKTLILEESSYLFDEENSRIAYLKKNVIVEKLKCNELFFDHISCKVKIKDLKGYIKEEFLWGKKVN